MRKKYNVTGMTCAACQARVQKSVSKLTGVQECNVNLLKNSMVVTYDDKNVNSGQIIAAVEKAGYGASLQQVKGKSAAQAVSPVDTAKKEYEAMRPSSNLVLCIHYPFVLYFNGTYVGLAAAGCLSGDGKLHDLRPNPVFTGSASSNYQQQILSHGFKTLFHGSPNMDSLIALGSGASLAYGNLRSL